MDNRPGCLSGIVKLIMLGWLFDWLQDRFGFGKGCSCTGIGCGCIMFILFVAIACSVLAGTNWLHLSF
jgi:hypothetical protein